MNDFVTTLKTKTEEISEIVLKRLPKSDSFSAVIFEAMEYSVANGGKRLRPLMVKEVYEALGGRKDKEEKLLEPFMAAIEMIHSSSLVHDDLPEMDNDLLRRGKPTTHAVYGQAMGVLAGDGLLNLAYETAASALEAVADDHDDLKNAARALKILGTKAGIYGMIGGQVVDVVNTGKPLSDEEIDFIYIGKTAALIESSLMMGAVLAGADNDTVDKFERIGRCTGIAFQIRDDILDETSTDEELGKPVHSDEENNKTTYVTIHGLDESQKKVDELTKEAENLLTGLGLEDSFLAGLLKFLVTRTK
ncbi:MAG: polyprenyl synthetase family protein [Lachnospiraceae bacterium]|nr:polyprenyl synthetase family protein [Lachnospiraceae bacterium]